MDRGGFVKLLRKKVRYGCEASGNAESPYLTRFTIIEAFGHALYLHKFHRSDGDEHHDHPWNFVSLILWRGYEEETPCGSCKGEGLSVTSSADVKFCAACYGSGIQRKRYWPGSILIRPATWRHRVVLVYERPAVTLVFRFPYQREWGFFTAKGWQRWREYFTERGC